MKTLFSVFSAVFLTVGSIIGAGFISGRELITFFGVQGFAIYLIISGVLFTFSLLLIYKAGRKFESVELFNKAIFSNPKPFNIAVIISTFISLGGVLSGLDNVFNLGDTYGLPIISTAVLLLANVASKYGVKGLERLSLVLVPLTVILIVVMLISKGKFNFIIEGKNSFGLIKCILYVSMNTFINLPVIFLTAVNKGKKSLIASAILVSLTLCSLAFLILGAIKFEGKGAINFSLPLLYVLSGEKASSLFSISLFLALLSSAVTAYYPLYQVAVSRGKRVNLVWVSVALILFSRIGIKAITDYVYPLVGAFGLVYLIRCAIYFIKEKKSGYKKKGNDDNKNKLIFWSKNMKKKKKKNKVQHLTDQEYGAYIMALKDEKPPKLIRETEGKGGN